jgi:hypothetical protein
MSLVYSLAKIGWAIQPGRRQLEYHGGMPGISLEVDGF